MEMTAKEVKLPERLLNPAKPGRPSIRDHVSALKDTVVFVPITLDGYFDMKEWVYDMRMFPDIANPIEVRDEGAEPVVVGRISFQPRRRLIGGGQIYR